MLKTDFADLARQVADAQPERRELTLEQEKAVVADRKLLLLAICCLSQWTFEQIVSTYTYTEAEVVKGFVRLDRLGIIELRPMNRYRLHVAKTFRWRPHGPVMQYFREQVVDDYYSGGFDGEGEMLMLVHGQIGRSLASTFIERLQRVGQDFAQQHLADQKLAAAAEAALHAGRRDAQLVVRRVSRPEARRDDAGLSLATARLEARRASGGAHFDAARPRLLEFRQSQRQHAVFQRGLDVLAVELAAEREAAAIAARTHFGIDGFQLLRLRRVPAALRASSVSPSTRIDSDSRVAPGRSAVKRDAGVVFGHIDERDQRRSVSQKLRAGLVVSRFTSLLLRVHGDCSFRVGRAASARVLDFDAARA